MATIEAPQTTSTLSDEAYDLISSFHRGVDDVVFQIAEELAKRRESEAAMSGRPIQIEVEDVREAGQIVAEALHMTIRSKDFDPRIGHALRGLTEPSDFTTGDER